VSDDAFDLLDVRGVHGWSDMHVAARATPIAITINHIFPSR
jgi:hypothetical protein